MRSPRPLLPTVRLITLCLVMALTGCAADRDHVRDDLPPTFVSRTGVPILMDIPVLGFFFGRTTVVR